MTPLRKGSHRYTGRGIIAIEGGALFLAAKTMTPLHYDAAPGRPVIAIGGGGTFGPVKTMIPPYHSCQTLSMDGSP